MAEKSALQLKFEMSEALSQAIGGASQLLHALRDPSFLAVRETLEVVRDSVLRNRIKR